METLNLDLLQEDYERVMKVRKPNTLGFGRYSETPLEEIPSLYLSWILAHCELLKEMKLDIYQALKVRKKNKPLT